MLHNGYTIAQLSAVFRVTWYGQPTPIVVTTCTWEETASNLGRSPYQTSSSQTLQLNFVGYTTVSFPLFLPVNRAIIPVHFLSTFYVSIDILLLMEFLD
jgi:hypothetical protein